MKSWVCWRGVAMVGQVVGKRKSLVLNMFLKRDTFISQSHWEQY